MIFVFGSNRSGFHEAGAALAALRQYGAVYGEGEGYFGNSYALPTVDVNVQPFTSLDPIKAHVDTFILFATAHPEVEFQVTAVGCGLAGLKHEEIAPMFANAPDNCLFDELWKPFLGDSHRYWGTHPQFKPRKPHFDSAPAVPAGAGSDLF